MSVNELPVAELRNLADELDQRYRTVRSRDGELVIHPAVKQRMELEHTVAERKGGDQAVVGRLNKRSDEIRRLKLLIQDQKCLNRILQTKVAEERRLERPNVPVMSKNLEGLTRKERAGEESARVLALCDHCLRTLMGFRKDLFAPHLTANWEFALEVLRTQVLHLKRTAIDEWTTEVNLTRQLAGLAQLKASELAGLSCDLLQRSRKRSN
jgi:hypothetical protein